MPTTISTRAVPLVLAAILAACGGSGTTAPPPTSAAVPNTPPSTILDTTPASDPTTSSTSAPSSSPTPSSPETTAVDMTGSDVEAVITAAEEAWQTFNEAKLDPFNDVKVQAALSAHTGVARRRVQDALDTYRASNLRSITNSAAPAYMAVNDRGIHVDTAVGVAWVELCNLNSNVMVEVGSNPDGSDRVIDDSVSAVRTLERYDLVDGRWLNSDASVLEELQGQTSCEPSS